MTYDIEFENGLPVCQRPNGPEECDGCYGMGYDGGTPLCMAAIRDAVAVAKLTGELVSALKAALVK